MAIEWRTIDTAPKGDGYVLLVERKTAMIAYFDRGEWHTDDGYTAKEPSHWAPLNMPNDSEMANPVDPERAARVRAQAAAMLADYCHRLDRDISAIETDDVRLFLGRSARIIDTLDALPVPERNER